MSRTDIIKKLAERVYGDTSEANIQQATQFCDTLVDIFTDALSCRTSIPTMLHPSDAIL